MATLVFLSVPTVPSDNFLEVRIDLLNNPTAGMVVGLF